jgi:uncharacterized protein YciI
MHAQSWLTRISAGTVFLGAIIAGNLCASEPSQTSLSESTYDAALAKRVGADERGMRSYVLVILKTGPKRMPAGADRDAMFAGHFANIQKLAKAGKLAVAGPFEEDPSGWRGLFVFAVDSIDEAKLLVETDPVVRNGEMIPEFHQWYGTAAAMLLPEWHEKLIPGASKSPR